MLINIIIILENYSSDIKYSDALFYLNYIQSILAEIKEIEFDINYNSQIEETGSIIPKNYSSILSETVYYQLLMNNITNVNCPDNISEQLSEVSTVAMKYQLLYYELILEELLSTLAETYPDELI